MPTNGIASRATCRCLSSGHLPRLGLHEATCSVVYGQVLVARGTEVAVELAAVVVHRSHRDACVPDCRARAASNGLPVPVTGARPAMQ